MAMKTGFGYTRVMCLLSFKWQPQGLTPLVMVSNRDEFHHRPTAPSKFWPEYPDVLAGVDLEAGGSWMGVNKDGRFAAITNVRQLPAPYKGSISRGQLVRDFLCQSNTPMEYLSVINQMAQHYDGFNLIVGNREQCAYLSNRNGHGPQELSAGLYGLSNAELDTPWPKVELAKKSLANWLKAEDGKTELYRLLNNRHTHPLEDLPNTGIGDEWEKMLSAQFIISPQYGTRACTALQIQRQSIQWQEASFNPSGELIQLNEQNV